MSDEPSNFALSISEALVEGDIVVLSQEDLSKLTDYERAVLRKTALRCDFKTFYDLVSGEVTFRRVFE